MCSGNKINQESKLLDINDKDNEIKTLIYDLVSDLNSNNIIENSENNKNNKRRIGSPKKQKEILIENQKILMKQISKSKKK